jgi:hypothetical protein
MRAWTAPAPACLPFERSSASVAERRGRFAFVLPALDLAVHPRDVSGTGLTIEGPASLPPGEAVDVEVVMPEGEEVRVRMTSVHCHLVQTQAGAQEYLTGLEPLTPRDGELLETVAERWALGSDVCLTGV